jgi:hypothetical protein
MIGAMKKLFSCSDSQYAILQISEIHSSVQGLMNEYKLHLDPVGRINGSRQIYGAMLNICKLVAMQSYLDWLKESKPRVVSLTCSRL